MTLDDLFAMAGTDATALAASRQAIGTLLRADGIKRSHDLDRVRTLTERAPMPPEHVALLSRALRRYESPVCPECRGARFIAERTCLVCGGTGQIMLFEAQAMALREAYDMRGGFLPMRVGSGKTLVTLLLATLLGVERAVLMLPASCLEKTRREFAIAFKAWRVRLPHLLSYEMLSHPDHEHDLLKLRPDLVICDEAHKGRNRDAAVHRRLRRCVELVNPIVVVLSGTLITDKLMDYQHLAVYALRGNAPLPAVEAEAKRWASAVDKDVPITQRSELGELESLGTGDFHEFFRSRRGIVPTPGSDCDAAIEISYWPVELPDVLRRTIAVTEASGLRPDGELLDPMRVADCLCELACGFYLKWRDPPPAWWLDPRRSYFGYERAIMQEHIQCCMRCGAVWPFAETSACRCPEGSTPTGFDSPETLRRALDRATTGKPGPKPPAWREGAALLEAWRAVKKQYKPVSVPVWLDDAPLVQLVHDVEPGTIVWTKRQAAGERLAALGVPYYGAGTDPESAGRIEGAFGRGAPTIACSLRAHGTGKNLQHDWYRMLFTHPPGRSDAWEQAIGREHRLGQRADTVYVRTIDAIDYHREVVSRVRAQARRTSTASGFDQKVLAATWLTG